MNNTYNEIIQKAGKKINLEVYYYDDNNVKTIITYDNIVRAKIYFNANLVGSVMQGLSLELKQMLPKKPIYLNIDASFDELNVSKLYGAYYLKEKPTYNADTKTYTHELCDEMLNLMVDYKEIEITYPTTLYEYFIAFINQRGYTTNIESLINGDKVLNSDIYKGINYTSRDVLDDIGQATATLFKVEGKEIKICELGTNENIVDDDILKKENISIGEHFGPINTIVLTRAGESDSIYYPAEVPENAIEFRISENQLMNGNDRDTWIEAIYNKLKGIEFDVYDCQLVGYGGFNPLDKVTIKTLNNNEEKIYNSYVFNNEIVITQGYEETIYTEQPTQTNTNYKASDTTDRRINETYLLVNKQQQQINALITNYNEQEEKIVKLQADVDGINLNVSKIDEEVKEVMNPYDVIEGNTPIEIANSSKNIPIEFEIEGKSEQGKIENLFDSSVFDNYKDGKVKYNSEDDTLILNGQFNDIFITNDLKVNIKNPIISKNNTKIKIVYVSGKKSTSDDYATFAISYFDESTFRIELFDNSTNDIDSTLLTGNKKYFKCDLFANGTFENYKVKIIVANSDDNLADYLPTPTNPIEIKTIKGTTEGNNQYLYIKSIVHNILNYNNFIEIIINKGIEFKNNKNGSVSVSGTSTGSSPQTTISTFELESGTYTLCGEFNKDIIYLLLRNHNDYSIIYAPDSAGNTTFILKEKTMVELRILTIIGSNQTINEIVKPMLVKGNKVLPYAPYQGSTSIIDMNIYDDNNNIIGHHEFVEVKGTKDIFKDGTLTKKIGKIDSYNGEEITTDYISTTGNLTNGATIYYVLNEPKKYNLIYKPLLLNKGYNNISILDYYDLKPYVYIRYLLDTPFADTYITRSESEARLTIESEKIETSIDAKYEKKFSNYSTTTEMHNAITQEVSEAENSIKLEVSKTIGDETSSATILAKINADESEVQIKADKVSLEGKVIDLTAENVSIASKKASINSDGQILLTDDGDLSSPASLQIESSSYKSYILSRQIFFEHGNINSTLNNEYLRIKNGDWTSYYSGTNILIDYTDLSDLNNVKSITYFRVDSSGAYIRGNLSVYGTKNRIVNTENYGIRLLNAYETATPYFGDIGSNETDSNGYCKINIDSIFKETIEADDYKVFIQECGEGKLYVKKHQDYFEVLGTPNLCFDWELKAIQKGYKNSRLDEYKEKNNGNN